ncbi:histidine kinase [Caloranaerobacter azorensis H53214]|uniref:Histidine kinase-, DNA gyrase B-, and HSP90-like ATPase n=2 Tax=Caloranaerobacter azorensis TaxID=116090 RepID=A0A1M5UEN8_9FIRM|nr:ATP-binding protein [Caloranaerobacter azorensis]KGG81193.1 histidine kinase [Caloranaerobacter azorensis H53214]SHH61123.1 Histidine kinase-, DNA gyrase B-, and HSP90-like ATPase [Caloranaerobacter azorensis DSM 13643]
MKELSLHILDLAENSLRAKATKININIFEDTEKDLLIIELEDNGIGMAEDLLRKVENPFVTSRTTRKVGLGIPLMKAAALRCEGDFKISSEIGKGTRVISIFKHSHIDRAPIGDIGQTIISLINANENVEIVYRHSYNGNCFVFDTREIKKILGNVSINEADIMLWIKDYINENVKNLYRNSQ